MAILERVDRNSVAYLTLNSPERLNALSDEMLEALQQGFNTTWTFSVQRNLAKNLQLSLNYNGRKSQENNPIHNGGVQLRAFF